MNRTFTSEDARKDKLFDAWIKYLQVIESQLNPNTQFDEIFEGLIRVKNLSRDFLSVHFEDGRKVKDFRVSPQISAHSAREDALYVILGRREGKWWPLEVVSIGSVIEGEATGIHMTVNPLLHAGLKDIENLPGVVN